MGNRRQLDDVLIRIEDLDALHNTAAVKRAYASYCKAIELDAGTVMVSRRDLASLIAMAATWLEPPA
jgi:hypothetical protein